MLPDVGTSAWDDMVNRLDASAMPPITPTFGFDFAEHEGRVRLEHPVRGGLQRYGLGFVRSGDILRDTQALAALRIAMWQALWLDQRLCEEQADAG